MFGWVKDPNAGGKKIPASVQNKIKNRILTYAQLHYAGKYSKLDIRFRGQFCYIDAYKEPIVPDNFPPPEYPESREFYIERLRNTPIHLCRLRYFGNEEEWGFAFFTYSNEKYELSVFPDGSFYGSPESAFSASALYLED